MVEVVEVGVLEQVRHGHAVQLSGGCKKQIIVQKTDTRGGGVTAAIVLSREFCGQNAPVRDKIKTCISVND